jgi:hypothetical protein
VVADVSFTYKKYQCYQIPGDRTESWYIAKNGYHVDKCKTPEQCREVIDKLDADRSWQ